MRSYNAPASYIGLVTLALLRMAICVVMFSAAMVLVSL